MQQHGVMRAEAVRLDQREIGLQNDETAGKFYEHCGCDGCGYGLREFSDSNSTGSVGLNGVWKAIKC